MSKHLVILSLLAIVGVGLGFVAGCETDAQSNALIGSGIGVGVAALTGGDSGDLMTGAAIGGGAGYIVGNESDKKKGQQRTDAQLAAIRAEQNIVSVWITNTNGSKQEVRLRKSGPNFIGPRGEVYSTMPTEEQLRQVYGF